MFIGTNELFLRTKVNKNYDLIMLYFYRYRASGGVCKKTDKSIRIDMDLLVGYLIIRKCRKVLLLRFKES